MGSKASMLKASWKDLIEEKQKGKKKGVWLSFILSVVTLLLSLPFCSWVWVINQKGLYDHLKITGDTLSTLHNGYSLYNLLSFVQNANMGSIGLFAMILLILMVVMVYFHLSVVVKILRGKKGEHGDLSLYTTVEAAFVFSIITSVATIGYVLFANEKFLMTGFMPSPVVYLQLIMGLVGYIVIKQLEKTERERCHEHGFLKELQKNWVLFVMLVPTFLYFMINNYLPMIGVYYAFTGFNFKDGLWASPFVGLKNFEFLIKADLLRLTRNTVLYNLVFIVIGNILQIVFAIFVSQIGKKWFKKTTQTLMFMPYFVSFVILKVLVYNIFEYQYGVANTIITGIGGERIDFYNNPSYWPLLITIFYMWKNIGYGMVVYLATIMGIDNELYDAAKVDGANIFQQIRYITMPQLKPTFIILLLYALGGIMKGQFELFYQMIGNNGVLYNVTDIIDTYVYRITMTQPLSIGLGTAAGLYQSLFGFVIIVITNWVVKKRNPDYALF